MKPLVRLFFKTVRLILTPIVLFVDWITTPKPLIRPEQEQRRIDEQTRGLVLYHFRSCPFCIKTRRAIKRLALEIEIRDAQKDPKSREELLRGGGQLQVPCLRITDEKGEVRWMYESSEIIAYLNERFGPQGSASVSAG